MRNLITSCVITVVTALLVAGCKGPQLVPSISIEVSPAHPQGLDMVMLDASASASPRNNPLQFAWSDFSGPGGHGALLTGVNTSVASFMPDRVGQYTVTLTVTDAVSGVSNTRNIAIDVASGPNPTASIAIQGNLVVGETLDLDGSGSSNASGIAGVFLQYQWSILQQPGSMAVQGGGSPNATITLDQAGLVRLKLVVTDTRTLTADNAEVDLTIYDPPRADIQFSGIQLIGKTITLDGTGSVKGDGNPPGNGELEYLWSFVSRPTGSSCTISENNLAAASFVPDIGGSYELRLLVTEVASGGEHTATDTIGITSHRLTVDLPGPLSQSVEYVLTESDAVFPLEVTTNDVEDIRVNSLAFDVDTPSAIDFADLWGGPAGNLVLLAANQPPVNNQITFSPSWVVPQNTTWQLELRVRFAGPSQAGQSATVTLDVSTGITAEGNTSATPLTNTNNPLTDCFVGPDGVASIGSDTVTWREWRLRNALVIISVDANSPQGNRPAPDGIVDSVLWVNLQCVGNPNAGGAQEAFIEFIVIEVAGDAQASQLECYNRQFNTVIDAPDSVHDSRMYNSYAPLGVFPGLHPSNFDFTRSIHVVQVNQVLSYGAAVPIGIRGRLDCSAVAGNTRSLHCTIRQDMVGWWDNGQGAAGSVFSGSLSHEDATPQLGSANELVYDDSARSAMPDIGAPMLTHAILVSDNMLIMIATRRVWHIGGTGIGSAQIWQGANMTANTSCARHSQLENAISIGWPNPNAQQAVTVVHWNPTGPDAGIFRPADPAWVVGSQGVNALDCRD